MSEIEITPAKIDYRFSSTPFAPKISIQNQPSYLSRRQEASVTKLSFTFWTVKGLYLLTCRRDLTAPMPSLLRSIAGSIHYPSGSQNSMGISPLDTNSPDRSFPVRSYFSPESFEPLETPWSSFQALCSSFTDRMARVYRTWATDWWALELLSWLSSALTLGLILITLFLCEDDPLPEWPLHITLNAWLSVLCQITQWHLMGSLTIAIGHHKWLWFAQRKRPLKDFVRFDEASRMPWGSFVLLVKGRVLLV